MKLGTHVILPAYNALAWARRAPIVKTFDHDTRAIRQAQPGAITVHRAYLDPYEQDLADPSIVIGRLLAQLNGFRPSFVELHNEWKQRVGQALEEHVAFTRACVERLHPLGLRVAGFSFSTGQPEMEDWLYLQEQGFAGVDAIALHEYWAKQGFSTWNALRYRRVHEWLGGRHPAFIVTECGRDALKDEGGEGQPGWETQGVDADTYVAELLAYNVELEKDDYVLGATVFSGGSPPDWANFDTDEIAPLMPGGLPPRADWQSDTDEQEWEMTQTEAYLTDMWRRQGVEPVKDSDAFWAYSLGQAETGRVIVPQTTKDGNYANYSDAKYVVAYTLPVPLWCEKGVWEVHEGFPPNP